MQLYGKDGKCLIRPNGEHAPIQASTPIPHSNKRKRISEVVVIDLSDDSDIDIT
jgi:hypothetical protein